TLRNALAEAQSALDESRAEAESLKDQALRARAEADNVRKRADRSIENAHKYALERFVNDLLPAVDSFERAVDAATDLKGSGGEAVSAM
ncbi:MAG: nucleotide exchange factor GrpE, partial [Gammaproteobacteria bacterium]|nr:nucleotide exchange factor GrpE [Gammaproteobacteria bacterium]